MTTFVFDVPGTLKGSDHISDEDARKLFFLLSVKTANKLVLTGDNVDEIPSVLRQQAYDFWPRESLVEKCPREKGTVVFSSDVSLLKDLVAQGVKAVASSQMAVWAEEYLHLDTYR